MSAPEEITDMDGELLGMLFRDGKDGLTESLFPYDESLMESWLSEQDVRHHTHT